MPDRPTPTSSADAPRVGGAVRRLLGRLPLVAWLRRSDRRSRRADLLAGLTVAAMLVPQGMAYAALAGMPPVTGLYASTVPLVAYALLGSSGQLAFGPVAIVSLLTASTLAPLAGGDPGTYATLAALLAVLVGAIQVLLGLVRAGRLTALLSHPVVSGFTSAAAIVIATSQLDKLLGVSIGSPEGWVERITAIVTSVDTVHLPTLAVGVVAIASLVLGRRLGPRVPTALLVVAVATASVPLLDLTGAGVTVIGDVPGGLPPLSVPAAPLATIVALLPGALIIALLSYLEGISVARAIAAETRDRIAPDRELVASGLANLAAGLVSAFPVAGGFSRTAVNHTAGARSPLASLVTAAGVLLALIALAPLFTTLPEVVLAAVVLVAVASLVDVRGARHAWRIDRSDGIALTITFVATLALGVEVGIGVGIAASLLISLWRVGQVRIDVVHRPDGDVVLLEGPLLPASAAQAQRAIEDHVASHPQLRTLTLDLSGCPSTDLSGIHALVAARASCRAADVDLRLVGARDGVAATLRRADVRIDGTTARSGSTDDTRGPTRGDPHGGELAPAPASDHRPGMYGQ